MASARHEQLLEHPSGHVIGASVLVIEPRTIDQKCLGESIRLASDRIAVVASHERAGRTPGNPKSSSARMRDAADDWRRFDAGAIPTKESTPHFDAFLKTLQQSRPQESLTVLDVGCGNGRLSRRMHEQGFSVLGVDVNREAVSAARSLHPAAEAAERWLRFEEADFASEQCPRLAAGPFDVVVCQLVISIIGSARNRANLLRHVRSNLRPGGWFLVSASGVSDTINSGYARLYAEDVHLTGERYSYLSRDARGEILYLTHHFTAAELVGLLVGAGFDEISVTAERETSSRRPDEAAYFLYATSRAGR